MAGNTSLMAAKVLAVKGIVTESLNGGITNLPEGRSTDPSKFVKVATE
jgi:cysteine synthase A